MNQRVLISGASIAGPALAYWLARRGFRPTVVERFGELRPGGNGVDIRGASVGIAERMGILPELRRHATQIDDTTFVDAGDRRTANIPMTTFNAGGDIEIMRGDLARVVHDATKDDVEYVFGDSISAIDDHGPAVTVTFDSGKVREFDLVVGADGLHSAVRGLTFGPDSEAMFEGAHLLAAELEAAGGDHTVAFRRYEEKFRPTVKKRQASVRASAAILIPRSRAGIWTRNQFTRLMGLQTAASFVYRRTTSLPEAG